MASQKELLEEAQTKHSNHNREIVLEIKGLPKGKSIEEILENISEIIPNADINVYKLGICDECGKHYKVKRKDHRFCSRECANRKRMRDWRAKNAKKIK